MEKHLEALKILQINNNKIGVEGVKCIAASLNKMKSIQVLDLSHDEIGDLGICELVIELDTLNVNLEEINLSGNAIGKNVVYFSKYAEILIHYF